jgi:hypothetical protein
LEYAFRVSSSCVVEQPTLMVSRSASAMLHAQPHRSASTRLHRTGRPQCRARTAP